jgi:glycosyltransferase involved in cell wall biosynthesis
VKILFVTNDVPFPPDNGVRIVTHHAMRLMRESGHQLALAVLTEDADRAAKYFDDAASCCQERMAWWLPTRRRGNARLLLSSAWRNTLLFVERYKSDEFRRRLEELVTEFRPDVVHFDLIPMSQYVDAVPQGVGSVASINDSWGLALESGLAARKYSGLERAYRQYELLRVRKYESAQYARFNVTHVMSERDAAYLRRLNPSINVLVIPNGVASSVCALRGQARERSDVLFVGKLAGDNLKSLRGFLRDGWPAVRRGVPDACLNVVGEVSHEARGLAEEAMAIGNVNFRGYVEHLVDAYAGSGVAIVPIDKECGILNKAVEAMAAGLAVVGFNKSFAGIPQAVPHVHFVCARDFQDMGAAVAELLQDRDRAAAIGEAAQELVVESYSWSSRGPEYERMYAWAANEAGRKVRAA